MEGTHDIARVVPRVKLIEEQTAIRKALLANGYSPLPAKEKMVTMKGWPKIEASEAEIENWALSHAFATTAIRIEGDLVAIDVDIDDPTTDDLCDLLENAVPALRKAPLRWGKGDKRMYLLRCPDRPKIVASHVFLRNGDQDDRHRLEIFGGGTTRYFTCYGPHTEGETTSEGTAILVEYEWADKRVSPVSLRPEQLPAVNGSELTRLVDIANEFLSGRGWERSRRSVSGAISSDPVFDLTEGMVFECSDGVDRTLDELRALKRYPQGLRCSASWHEPGAKNRSRCLVEKHHDGEPKVFDFDEYRWHLPENADKRTAGEKQRDETTAVSTTLGAALSGMGYADIVGEELLDEWFEEQVEKMLDEWGWMPGTGQGFAVYLPDASREKMTMASFREAHASIFTHGEPGPNGGRPKKYTATAIWSAHPRRVQLAGYRYKPGVDERLIEEDGQVWINNYLPPLTVVQGAHLDVWEDFIEHLLPNEEERDWFHNWLAWKVQHPADRGAAVVFVSEGVQGTGRGTMFSILRGVFGSSNVADVPYGKLVGAHGQSQFDEWRLDKVLVYCNEASSSEGAYYASAKRKQYDALKDIVDPASSEVTVNVKGEKTRTDRTYISVLIASNYADTLPLDQQDRRFTVLTTPNKLEEEGRLYQRLFGQCFAGGQPTPEFTTAIRRFYLRMDPVQRDFMRAMDTEAKTEMAELAEGPVERLVRERIEIMGTPAFISATTLCASVDTALQQRGLSKMSGHTRNGVSQVLAAMGYQKHTRVRIENVRHVVYKGRGVDPALLAVFDLGELVKA